MHMNMKRDKITVIFQPDGKHGKVGYGITILEAARKLGVDLASVCGGKSLCGKCKVIIKTGKENLGKPIIAERKLLSKEELREGYRLACVTKIRGNLIIIVPDESRVGQQRLQTEGIEVPIKLDPFIKKINLTLPLPSFEDLRSDADRLLSVLKSNGNLFISYNIMGDFPLNLREKEWMITVTILNDREIINIEPGKTADRNYGFAVDIGTTKMAGYLMDLNTGRLLSASSLMNPQIPFGEDVITRIAHAKGSKELRELHKAVLGGINQMLEEVCEKSGVLPKEVYETTVVGNTVMHHLFLNICPKFLAMSPYVPAIQRSMNVKPSELGVKTYPNGNVHVLPIMAGFVGADCVAAILATEIHKSRELCFLIDVGTNTEIVIGNKDGLTACSCASGPAFEGAFIKHGMRASTGAIEKIWIDPEEVEYLTIGNTKPRGICGSAIVDIPAEMLKAGVMDTTGRILTEIKDSRIRKRSNISEFVIARGKETESGEDVVITQSDIREIQKAKAAMYAGASILLKKLGIAKEDICTVFIAGAFGNYIAPTSAKIIGMLPDFSTEIIKHVGNAAGTGARMALLSKEARETSDEIGKIVHYIELAAEPGFEEEYINAMYFPHLDLKRFPDIMKALKGTRLNITPRHRALQSEIRKQNK